MHGLNRSVRMLISPPSVMNVSEDDPQTHFIFPEKTFTEQTDSAEFYLDLI